MSSIWQPTFRQYLRAANIEHLYPKSPTMLNSGDIAALKQLDYVEQWKYAREECLYHLYLSDHSFFIFKINDTPSYSYFDCPLEVKTISEYLVEIGWPVTEKNINLNKEDYDEYISTANIRNNVTPIRYDYDVKSYKTGIHPAAHIHIGLDNQIRIGMERQLTPLAFLLFVIRQMYPENWKRLLDNPISSTLPRKTHLDLEMVSKKYFGSHEKSDLYLAARN